MRRQKVLGSGAVIRSSWRVESSAVRNRARRRRSLEVRMRSLEERRRRWAFDMRVDG